MFFFHAGEGGTNISCTQEGGGDKHFSHTGGGGQTFYVRGVGGYDDVDEEMDVSEAKFFVSEANISVSEASKLSAGPCRALKF